MAALNPPHTYQQEAGRTEPGQLTKIEGLLSDSGSRMGISDPVL